MYSKRLSLKTSHIPTITILVATQLFIKPPIENMCTQQKLFT